METKQQHATVHKILMDQIVTCCFAVFIMYHVTIVVHVQNQISKTQMTFFGWNCIPDVWKFIRKSLSIGIVPEKTIGNTIWKTMILESLKVVNAVKRME